MAAAILDLEIKSARAGAFANRSTNTSLYSLYSRSTSRIQNADAVEARS